MNPLLELVEDHGEACYEHGRLGADFGAEEAYDKAGELLDEISAAVAELERDAARYRWLRGEVEGPHVPMAQVIWKLHCIRDSGNWTNLADGLSLDEHIDKELEPAHVPDA